MAKLKGQLIITDKDGNDFDLTQWYIDHAPSISLQSMLASKAILDALQKIETHLSLITGEELKQTDIEQDEEL
jgi:hypothetical protein